MQESVDVIPENLCSIYCKCVYICVWHFDYIVFTHARTENYEGVALFLSL